MFTIRRASIFLRLALLSGAAGLAGALPLAGQSFSRADSIRGSNTPERSWWDVVYYDLNVSVRPSDSSISGFNAISYRVVSDKKEMQLDLMQPLTIDSVLQRSKSLKFRRDGDAFYIDVTDPQTVGQIDTVKVFYSGKPRVAKNPPWDGGFVWARDSQGNPWVATACQGLGASVWWPNKDAQFDEPDSQRITITAPDPLVGVSNGRLRSRTANGNGTSTYVWFVSNPINNYNVALNVGMYENFQDTFEGEEGKLDLSYWPLAENLEKAKKQFPQSKPMLACFEKWFGPYPWYADSYKLIEAPFLGMEHQSGVAYGNKYADGYLGKDLSASGWGLKWDFIIIHESGHEWFGNNITTADIADMWVHESFTNYSEGLYTECLFGKEAGADYIIGLRKKVLNDKPVIGKYGFNSEGSSDMYYKGSNMLHTIRTIIDNDDKWRSILRGLNATFRHSIVTGKQVEDYINEQSGRNFSPVFRQYLATTNIPTFAWKMEGDTLLYRWQDAVDGFNMPVRILLSSDYSLDLEPTKEWQRKVIDRAGPVVSLKVDRNYYVNSINADPAVKGSKRE